VVDRPQFFKFASGGSFKTGVMGEAGPEAILPLKRGADGKLGVTMNGGTDGGTVVNITVNENGQTKQEGATGDAGQLAQRIKGAVLQVIVNEKRPGGLLYG
jgi:phage-related minor tail protein